MTFYDKVREACPTLAMSSWDVDCPEGWQEMVLGLLKKIDEHALEAKMDIEIAQVKSKFGTLRCYIYNGDEVCRAWIRDAEERSATMCEVCGGEAQRRVWGTWIVTMCDEHNEQGKNK